MKLNQKNPKEPASFYIELVSSHVKRVKIDQNQSVPNWTGHLIKPVEQKTMVEPMTGTSHTYKNPYRTGQFKPKTNEPNIRLVQF